MHISRAQEIEQCNGISEIMFSILRGCKIIIKALFCCEYLHRTNSSIVISLWVVYTTKHAPTYRTVFAMHARITHVHDQNYDCHNYLVLYSSKHVW